MDHLKDLIQSKNVVVPDTPEKFRAIFEHFRGKDVGQLQGDLRPLLSSSEDFYCVCPSDGLLQGDILSGPSAVFIDQDGEAAANEAQHEVMVLSSECDAEFQIKNHQAYVRVCPVYEEAFVVGRHETDKAFTGNLRANRINEFFWMPALNGSCRIADLSLIYAVDLPWLHRSLGGNVQRVASLSKEAHYLLSVKLAWLFLRPTVDSRRGSLAPIG